MKYRSLLVALMLVGSVSAQVPTTINIEIDYMETAQHSHKPSQVAIDAVVQMFACHNITANIVVDDAIPEVAIVKCPSSSVGTFFNCFGVDSFSDLKDRYANQGSGSGWHYAIFGHEYDNGSGIGSSGFAEVGGNDFIVTLGSFGTVGTAFDQAATLAHELGHNLGLRHWSPGSIGVNGPYSPIYASTMSYQYQLSGIHRRMTCLGVASEYNLFKEIDYSNGRLPGLVESILVENTGAGMRAVDWDCDGVVDSSTVSKDLDDERNFCTQGTGNTFLDDWDDWANIVDNTDNVFVYTDAVPLELASCITFDQAQAVNSVFDPAAFGDAPLPNPSPCWTSSTQPFLIVESCKSGRMIWLDAVHNGAGVFGTGSDPYKSFAVGVAVAPPGSQLYLQPGTFTNNGNTIVLDKPLTVTGVGSSYVDP